MKIESHAEHVFANVFERIARTEPEIRAEIFYRLEVLYCRDCGERRADGDCDCEQEQQKSA